MTSTPLRSDGPPLVSLTEAYVDAVAGAGGLPLVLPTMSPEFVEPVLAVLDGIVLSGGGDVAPGRYGQVPSDKVGGIEPDRDDWELELVAAAIARGRPVLAICRGAQVLNVALGGTLIQDLPSLSLHPHRDDEGSNQTGHPVRVDPSSRLAEVFGRSSVGDEAFGTNTLHHQAVDRLGKGLRAVAWALDETIEAIEAIDSRPLLGVQWHPELLQHCEEHRALFAWVVSCASERRDAGTREERTG